MIGLTQNTLKTEEFELNASTVPENITVNNLANILDAINFTDSQGPGYMPPTTRKEANRTFEPDDLRQHLHDFIRRVNTREAFLGTPPRCDFIRLMDFYQQIEDAVRLSIHKVTSDVEEFERINGTDYHSFDQKKKNEYNDLLQRRARVALDLAIAGAHCGARYMGEAMDVYYSTHGGDGQSDPENASLVSRFEQFQTLLADLKKEKVALPETEDWDDFIAELFVLDRVKEKLNILSSKTDLVEQKRWRNALKESCSKEKLGSFLVEELRKALESDTFVSIPTERYMPVCTVKAQIAEMKKVLQTRYELQINEDTLSRVLDGKTDLREAVKNSLDRDRRNAFLACLNQDQNLEEIDTNGISKELMEWLLVSQGVLTPQLKQECTKVNIDRSFSENYIEVVHQGFCNNPKTPIEAKNLLPLEILRGLVGKENERLVQELSIHACATSGKRYSFAESKKERVLTWVFQQSFQHNSDEVIAATQITNRGKELYLKWKTVCLIELPKTFGNLFSHPYFKTIWLVSVTALVTFSLLKAHVRIMHFLTLPVDPVFKRFMIVIAGLTIARNLQEGIWSMFDEVSLQLHRIAQNAEKDTLIKRKWQALKIWKSCQPASVLSG